VKHSIFKLYLFALGLLVLWWSSVVYAADINFAVNTGVSYDSNVFRADTAKNKGVYFTLAPKVDFKLPFNKAYFSLTSRTALDYYLRHTDANLQELIFSGLGRYELSDYLSFGLQDSLIISGRLKSADRLTDVTRRREFMDNRFSSSLKYELKGGALASLQYANIVRNYKHAEKGDWIRHAGQLQIQYPFGYKTSTQVVFGLTRKGYNADVDYISIPMTISLKRKLSYKLGASFSLGLEGRRYDEAHRARNVGGLTMSIDITGKFAPNTTSRLGLQRKVRDSDVATGYAFVSKGGDIALILNLGGAAQLILQGLYSRNSYIQLKRTDNLFEGRGAIRYSPFKWGAVALGYGYEKGTSSVQGQDYQRHGMDVSIDLAYLIALL